MNDDSAAEYHGLRATIRERGTLRICVVTVGLIAMSALVVALRGAHLSGAIALLPLLVLAATFEINFFVHTGVERIGRYLQVFHEERGGTTGWETTAMNYGAKYPSGLDPLFSVLFAAAAMLDFSAPLWSRTNPDGWRARSPDISRSLTESSQRERLLRRNGRWISIAFAACYPSDWFRAPKLRMSWLKRHTHASSATRSVSTKTTRMF